MNLAIIQARNGSTRLPNKVMVEFQDKPCLQHIIERLKQCQLIDKIVVATTNNKDDDRIVGLCELLQINYFRGSENNVLDRFFRCAEMYKYDNIIRITGDCPVIDPGICDLVIAKHMSEDNDYTTNDINNTFPDGLGLEVMKFSVLKKCWMEAITMRDKEHVTLYIKDNPDKFKIAEMKSDIDYSDKRWTLDTVNDLLLINAFYNNLYMGNPYFGMKEILAFLEENPEVENFNKKLIRDEAIK